VLLDESREEHQLLVESLLTHRTALEMHELVLALFTPEERREFGRRLQIVKMLKAGVSQREIARELGVGIATVSRGSHEVKRGAFQKVV
jgi:TrpR family trp operon transcriptional repressor